MARMKTTNARGDLAWICFSLACAVATTTRSVADEPVAPVVSLENLVHCRVGALVQWRTQVGEAEAVAAKRTHGAVIAHELRDPLRTATSCTSATLGIRTTLLATWRRRRRRCGREERIVHVCRLPPFHRLNGSQTSMGAEAE